ncbi:MAG: DUF998 domain-containing protein, partial [Chloroflexota bacterium]
AAAAAGWLAVLPFVGWVAFAAARGELSDAVTNRGTGGWVTLALFGLLTWAFATWAIALATRRSAAAPAAALGAVG